MTKAELTAENRPACEHCQPGGVIREMATTHEDQGGIEIIIILLHVFAVVLHRLSFIHCVEVNLGVVALDWWEVRP